MRTSTPARSSCSARFRSKTTTRSKRSRRASWPRNTASTRKQSASCSPAATGSRAAACFPFEEIRRVSWAGPAHETLRISSNGKHAAALDPVAAGEHDADCFRVDAVFLGQDARRERFDRVVVFDRNRALQDDRAGVEVLIYKVHGAAGDLDAVFQRLLLGVEPGKGRQQGRMNVENPLRKGANKSGAEQAHEAGQAHQLDLVVSQLFDQHAVVNLAVEAAGRK